LKSWQQNKSEVFLMTEDLEFVMNHRKAPPLSRSALKALEFVVNKDFEVSVVV
jgi:hypothetical protein